MKEMNKIERFTDKEWEELASMLSDENREQTDLLDRFIAGDTHNSGSKWKELKNMNNQKEVDVDKAWNNVHSRLVENGFNIHDVPVRTSFMRLTVLKIAAVAIILLSVGTALIYMNNSGYLSKKITVIAEYDQKNIVVSLPDGSTIYLNRNSEVNYRKNFIKYGRNVKLIGEAYFEVSPDITKPFIIDAGNAKVKVVGTSFNVISNNSESAVEVFVESGKVMVSDKSDIMTIQLDQGFVGTMSSKATARTLNTNPNYLSWKTGLLVYNGQTLDVVFNDLKRVFNMDIIADDRSILENTWTSPIDNQSQETIIRIICRSFNLGYTKDGTAYHLTKK